MANYEVVSPEMCKACRQWASSVLMHPSDVLGLTTRTFINQAQKDGWPLCGRCMAMANYLYASLDKIDRSVRKGVGQVLGKQIAAYWSYLAFDDGFDDDGPPIGDYDLR